MPKDTILCAKGDSHYWSGRLSIGVFVNGTQAVLIDSGLDKSTAKALNKALKQQGLTVAAIINTHSHADHCGGNAYFQSQYPGLKIYATRYERHFIDDTTNEPRCFCRGAAPLKELRNKFLEAPPSDVTDVIHPYQDQAITINGKSFQIITLPGHSPGMIGVVTPDNVFYTGDAIFGNDTLDKHGILFFTDIEATLQSFKKLAGQQFDEVVFYHGGLMARNLSAVLDTHTDIVKRTEQLVLDLILEQPRSITDLTQAVMQKLAIPANPVQFTLTETCVQAYVTHLQQQNAVVLQMHESKLLVTGPDVDVAAVQSAQASGVGALTM